MGKVKSLFILVAALTFVSAACGQKKNAKGENSAQQCESLETRTPNASEQKPAFSEQTRACAVKSDAAFDVVIVAKGLKNPWAVEQLPGGDFLITEKSGQMRIVSAKGEIGEPLGGLLHARLPF